MDAPSGDVHGGFVLQLNWLHAGQQTAVQSKTDTDTIFAQYSDADRASVPGKWKVCCPAGAPNDLYLQLDGTSSTALHCSRACIAVPSEGTCGTHLLNTRPFWLQIPFPFSNIKCGANACSEGRYEIVKFGTLSLFDDSGDLATDYTAGKKMWADSPPTGSIYYGEGGMHSL